MLFKDKSLQNLTQKYRNPYFVVISETDFLQKLAVEENVNFNSSVFKLCSQGLDGIFECVFLILPHKPQEGRSLANGLPKYFKWTPDTPCFIVFSVCRPIFGQIGPIVGNALGHLMKAFPWIGPKSKNRT